MDSKFVAKAEITIHAPKSKIWEALTNPDIIKQYFFGTDVVSDWEVGSPIVWKGVWKEKPYEDKGVILKVQPEQTLQYTHFSGMSGAPDVPENYHTLTYELSGEGDQTHLSLTQDNNASEDEMKHSQQMWESMLESLKKVLEQ